MSNKSLFWKRFRTNKPAVFGLTVLCIYLVLCLSANLLFDPAMVKYQDLTNVLQPPSAAHLLGTDNLGRDLLTRMVYGARYSLSIGVIATGCAVLIGCLLGSACAYFGGWFDNLCMRLFDVLYCIPFLLLAMLIVAVLGKSMVNLIIAVTVGNIPGFTKMTRGAVLAITESDYVKAARACGTGPLRIITRHILPNAVSVLAVEIAFSLAATMLAASSLSFLGLGVQEPTPEWGAMLANARDYIRTNPHMILIPGSVIALASVSITLVGDGIRDGFDPKTKI